jgi:hypothetical protein
MGEIVGLRRFYVTKVAEGVCTNPAGIKSASGLKRELSAPAKAVKVWR